MSFMRLLAAGRSIMGIKKKPGPYRMNQENLLPKFPSTQKPASTVRPSAAARANEPEASSEGSSPAPESGPASAPAAPAAGESAERPATDPPTDRPGTAGPHRVLRRVTVALARLTWRARSRQWVGKATGRAVQTELSIDTVKVVRNDLTDCEAETVGREGAWRGGRTTAAQRQPLGMVWNRLSARLLRQAVQEFNLAQKERGKLLSQAGHGSGGARSA